MYLKNKTYNFDHFLYSKGKKYRWPSTAINAKKILSKAAGFTNLFELLCDDIYDFELSLHKDASSFPNGHIIDNCMYLPESLLRLIKKTPFYKSFLTKEQYFSSLKMSTWTMQEVVLSAVFFIFEQAIFKNDRLILKDYFYLITPLFFQDEFSIDLITIFLYTNIIVIDAYFCILGFKKYLFENCLNLNKCTINFKNLSEFYNMINICEETGIKISSQCAKQNSMYPLIYFLEKNYLPQIEEKYL